MIRFNTAIVLCLVMLISCGGGGGHNDIASDRPTRIAQGYGIDAAIVDASVAAYSWENGAKGDLLGNATTDEYGYYSISIQAQAQPIILELSGGSYTEEASGEKVDLTDEQKLYAVTNYSGEDIDIMITPFTTLAAGLAQYYIVEKGQNTPNAITLATSEITGITAFNILTEYPINITLEESYAAEMTDGHMYGFYSAAFSSWTAEISEENGTDPHNPYTSIYLTDLMYKDVLYDGVLNGEGITSNGEPGSLFVGSVELNAETYRLKIAQHVLIAAAAEYNHTGLTANDVLEQAHTFSQRVSDLYDNESPAPLDTEGPRVYQVEPLGKYYKGEIDYVFRIVDIVGIDSVSVSLDGDALEIQAPEGTTADIVLSIDTTQYGDGEHTLEMVSSDMLENESTHTLTILTNNSGIKLNLETELSLTREASIEIAGSYELSDTTLDTISVNGEKASLNQEDQTFTYRLDLVEGVNEVSIVGTDTIGNKTEFFGSVAVDRTNPEIITNDDHGYHRFYIGDGDITNLALHDENTGDPLYINYYNKSLNGTSITKAALKAAEIPFFTMVIGDLEGEGVFTPDDEMTVETTYFLEGQEVNKQTIQPVEDTANQYIIPVVTEFLTDSFIQADEEDVHSINVKAYDKAGNFASKLLTFKAYIDAPELTLTTLNNRSTVRVYSWENGEKGGVIAEGQTKPEGTSKLTMFSDAGPILIELSSGRYEETGSGGTARLNDEQTLTAVTYFNRQSLAINVTPLTHVAVSEARRLIVNGNTVKEAVSAANRRLSTVYGFDDILTTGIADIADDNSAAPDCTDDYRHAFILAGLSNWSYEKGRENGATNRDKYNSILLADLMAADMFDDGQLNGGQFFGATPLDTAAYQSGFGQAIADAILYYNGNTQLTVNDFVGVDFSVSDTQEADDIFGATFLERHLSIDTEVNSVNFTLKNNKTKPIYVILNDVSDQSTVTHQYYEAIRKHKIEETKDYQYRARTSFGDPTSYSDKWWSDYGEWRGVTYYLKWNKGTNEWSKIEPSRQEKRTYNSNNDSVPGRKISDYRKFIISSMQEVGQPRTQRLNDRPVRFQGNDYWIYYDFVAPELGEKFPISWLEKEGPEIYNKTWAKWLVKKLDPNDTGTFSPEIQRHTTTTWRSVEGPYNEITEEYSDEYKVISARVSAKSGTGNDTPGLGGYIVSPGEELVIKKYVTTPSVRLYAFAEPAYHKRKSDKSLTWVIDQSISLNVITGTTQETITQMPKYEMALSGSQTYLIEQP